MFDVGFSELLIIAVVALVVLGPERLPKAARFAGLWVRKARAQWYAVKSELELELAQDEMKKHLQSVENSIKAPMQELQQDLQSVENSIKAPMQELQQDLQQSETEINQSLDDAAGAPEPVERPADGAGPEPRTFNVFADRSGDEVPETAEASSEPEPEAIAFEMDEPPGRPEAMPDGPVLESADDQGPDESQPKQGMLW
jgi:sec-independent protein translocase protein TatB